MGIRATSRDVAFFTSKGPDVNQTLSLSVCLYSNFYVSYRFLFFVSSSNVF